MARRVQAPLAVRGESPAWNRVWPVEPRPKLMASFLDRRNLNKDALSVGQKRGDICRRACGPILPALVVPVAHDPCVVEKVEQFPEKHAIRTGFNGAVPHCGVQFELLGSKDPNLRVLQFLLG